MRTIRGVAYRRMRAIYPNESVYLITGNQIAIEHWAYEIGQHYFDYEVNSRSVGPDGRPTAIASMRSGLEREFMERRVNTRGAIPVSIGDSDGNRIPEVGMTYGELAPQIYQSRVAGPQVAWSIKFRRQQYVAAQTPTRTALTLAGRKPDPVHHAENSVRAQNMQGGHNYLVLWVPASSFSATRFLPNGFGVLDYIGENPPLYRRIWQMVTGQ